MRGLTRRQSEILNFINSYISTNQYSPSYQEIMNRFGFSSLGTIHKHIHVLKRKGVLDSEHQKGRSLFPTEASKNSSAEIELPFIGLISMGQPIEMFAKTQTLAVPDFLVQDREKTYVLRARGNSLNEEMIADGDLIIVEAQSEAHSGTTIVGMINSQTTIIKKYYIEEGFVRLEGAIPHKPIRLRPENLLIQGVVKGLIRVF